MATRFCDLPEKVLVEIMSWLPPESLAQCKCVQKSWHALIDTLIKSRWFVAKHLENSGSRSSFLFLRGELTSFTNPHMTHDEIVTDMQLVNSYNVCDEKNEIHFNTQLMTSTTRPILAKAEYRTSLCNGIIFQTETKSNKIMLCNPTTREFNHLDPDLSCFFGFDFKTFVSGFGYDAIDNVYKIVRVVSLPSSSSGDCKSASFGAEVCTLGSDQGNSSWREIRMIDVGKYFTTYACRGMYHRGFIYWMLSNLNAATERMIISFDMHGEEFQVVPLPSGIVDDPMEFNTVDGRNRVTQVRKGVWFSFWNQCPTLLKIVMITLPRDADVPKPVEVWKMKTDSSSSRRHERFSCWVKHATFSPPLERFSPLAFWKSDELLLGTGTLGRFASYNLRTRKVRTLRLHPQTAFTYLSVFVDVKSFVSMNNYLS